jgi:hypothetical protein
LKKLLLMAVVLGAGLLSVAGDAAADAIPSGWTCTGSCGSSGVDGVVTLSPAGNSSFEWVSTNSGSDGVGALPTGGLGMETNGSVLNSPVFKATAGQALNFYFNYVTSDGANALGNFADYAWVELSNSSNSPVALLFTARTAPSGSIVPGVGLPAPLATLKPASVPIIPGGPNWSPLGDSSGQCFAAGCGFTGWINSDFVIQATGDYHVSFGTVNWIDTAFDSGLAIDGLSVGGVPVGPGGGEPPPTSTPEPGTLLLLGAAVPVLIVLKRMA